MKHTWLGEKLDSRFLSIWETILTQQIFSRLTMCASTAHTWRFLHVALINMLGKNIVKLLQNHLHSLGEGEWLREFMNLREIILTH